MVVVAFVMVVVAFVMVVVALVVMVVALVLVVVIFMPVFVVFILVIVVTHSDHGKLDGIDAVTKRDDLGLVRTGVVQQILEPVGLQFETDSQHEVRIRYPGDVAGSRQKCVRIGARFQQAEDLYPVSTYHTSPVG